MALTCGAVAAIHAIFFVHVLAIVLLDKRGERKKHGAVGVRAQAGAANIARKFGTKQAALL